MSSINYPEIEEPYATALRQAIDYVIDSVHDIVGIIAAGSILRGNGDERSDIDMVIITKGTYRQRIHKFFNTVRFELFINACDFIPLYFDEEKRDGGASTAHMLTTGHLISKNDPIVDDLIKQAQDMIDSGPQYISQSLTLKRYMLADRFENGLDLRERDPIMGQVMIDAALSEMLIYQFQKQGKWVPRHKEILEKLRQVEPQLAKLVAAYYTRSGDERFDIALQIADYTIEARGFFEWEMEKDYLD